MKMLPNHKGNIETSDSVGQNKILSLSLLILLLICVSITHFSFFSIDQRPPLDHDESHSDDVIPMYNKLLDEGLHLKFLLIPFCPSDFESYFHGLKYPPIISMFMSLVLYFAAKSFFIFKMTNLPFIILLILSVYVTAKELNGYTSAILASFFAATMPILLNFSRKSTLFFPEAALYMLSLYFFLKTDDFQRRGFSLLFALTTGLMALTHYRTIAYIGLFFIVSLLNGKPSRKKIANGASSLILSAAIWIPWYRSTFLQYFDMRYDEWASMGNLSLFSSSSGKYIFDIDLLISSLEAFILELHGNFMLPIYFYLWLVTLPLTLIIVTRKTPSRGKLIIVGTFFLAPFFITIIHHFFYRHTLYTWFVFMPPLCILLALSLVILWRRFCHNPFFKIVGFSILFIVVFNGLFLLLAPLKISAQDLMSTDSPFSNSSLSKFTKKWLGGSGVYSDCNILLFPSASPFYLLNDLVSHFKDMDSEADIVLTSPYVDDPPGLASVFFTNLSLVSFFEGGAFFSMLDIYREREHDYVLLFYGLDDIELIHRDGGITLKHNTPNEAHPAEYELDGFFIDAIIPVKEEDSYYLRDDFGSSLKMYILKREGA